MVLEATTRTSSTRSDVGVGTSAAAGPSGSDAGGDDGSAERSSDFAEACFHHAKSKEPTTTDFQHQKDGPGKLDHAQSGLLHLWWGVIQDQLGTLTREIDSLRQANSQMQMRQTEALVQRSEAQAEAANESMAAMARLTQEQETLRAALQAEHEERTNICAAIWEAVRQESEKQSAAFHEEQKAMAARLEQEERTRVSTEEEFAEVARRLAASIESQADDQSTALQVLQAEVHTLRADVATERETWAQRRADIQGKIVQYIEEQRGLLMEERTAREAAERQTAEERADRVASLELLDQKVQVNHASILAEVANLRQDHDTSRKEHQKSLDNLESLVVEQIAQVQLDVAKATGDLQEKLGVLQQSLADPKTELRQVVNDMCAKERDQTKQLLSRAKQILDTDEGLRQRLQTLLASQMVSRTDFTSEIDRLWRAVDKTGNSATRMTSSTRSPCRRSPSVQTPTSSDINPRQPVTPVSGCTGSVAVPASLRSRSGSPSARRVPTTGVLGAASTAQMSARHAASMSVSPSSSVSGSIVPGMTAGPFSHSSSQSQASLQQSLHMTPRALSLPTAMPEPLGVTGALGGIEGPRVPGQALAAPPMHASAMLARPGNHPAPPVSIAHR